jgi:hypothetical protein
MLKLNVSLQSVGGHTEISFEGGTASLEWKETTANERKGLRTLVEKAQGKGFTTTAFDEKGAEEAITGSLPSAFFEKPGKLALKGDGGNLKFIAEGLVEAEIAKGRIVGVLNDENTFDFVCRGEKFEAKTDGTEQKVVVQDKAVGG